MCYETRVPLLQNLPFSFIYIHKGLSKRISNFRYHLSTRLGRFKLNSYYSNEPYNFSTLPKIMEKNSSLTNDGLILTFKNKEQMYLKTLYDDHSSKLMSIISLIVNNEERRMEILEKTFTRIYLEAKKYDPVHSTVFIWMMRVAISVSSEYLDIQLSEIQKKFWEVYKELRTKNQ